MQVNIDVFFMTSSEDSKLKQLRRCIPIKRFHAPNRDDYLLIRVTPPLEGHWYGISSGNITELVIATRHKGVSLFPVKKWPVSVYVLRPLINDPEHKDTLRDDELTLIGWAEIYDSQLSIY